METVVQIAERFGKLIAKADYLGAFSLLTAEAQAVHSPDEFKEIVARMNSYAPGPILEVEAMEEYMLEDWPDKKDTDLAIVYVALEGHGFSEAVSVILAQEHHQIRIRELEWGRP